MTICPCPSGLLGKTFGSSLKSLIRKPSYLLICLAFGKNIFDKKTLNKIFELEKKTSVKH